VTTPRLFPDFVIEYGKGYYIVTKAPTYFTLTGDLQPTSTHALAKGWNMIGYDKLAPMKASELISHISGCKVYKVSYLDTATGKYYAYIPGISSDALDFTVTPGRAYFVVTAAPGTLTLG